MSYISDDDIVIKEYDVFSCKALNELLHLLQHPQQRSCMASNQQQHLVAKMKPQNKKLQIDLSLDTSSPNYSQSKGEQIAINVGEQSNNDHGFGSNLLMDHQTLVSSLVPHTGSRYAAAYIHENEVHLNLIKDIYQMRSGLQHMDKTDVKVAAEAARKLKEGGEGDTSDDDMKGARTVTVKFKGAETEAARLARQRSYAAYEKKVVSEKWAEAAIHSQGHSYTDRELNRLICRTHEAQSSLPLTCNEYMSTLKPNYVDSSVDGGSDTVFIASDLGKLSLPEQLKAVMKSTKIIHFYTLLSLLPGSPDPNAVVRLLQSYAVLIQGCWIVKSDLLFPSGTISTTGVCSEKICKARDLLLCCFANSRFISRSKLVALTDIPGEELKIMFEQISCLYFGHWTLRLPPDIKFASQYPEVCERQGLVWEARSKQLRAQLNLTNNQEITDSVCDSSFIQPPVYSEKHISIPQSADCIAVKNEPVSSVNSGRESTSAHAVSGNTSVSEDSESMGDIQEISYTKLLNSGNESNVPDQSDDVRIESPFVKPETVGIKTANTEIDKIS